MTLFNLSVYQTDADPVVDSSTFSDLRPVVGLNVDTSTSFAVTSTSVFVAAMTLFDVDVTTPDRNVIEINGISILVILTKPN